MKIGENDKLNTVDTEVVIRIGNSLIKHTSCYGRFDILTLETSNFELPLLSSPTIM